MHKTSNCVSRPSLSGRAIVRTKKHCNVRLFLSFSLLDIVAKIRNCFRDSLVESFGTFKLNLFLDQEYARTSSTLQATTENSERRPRVFWDGAILGFTLCKIKVYRTFGCVSIIAIKSKLHILLLIENFSTDLFESKTICNSENSSLLMTTESQLYFKHDGSWHKKN